MEKSSKRHFVLSTFPSAVLKLFQVQLFSSILFSTIVFSLVLYLTQNDHMPSAEAAASISALVESPETAHRTRFE